MPLVKDRVKQTTTTTGTGSVALSGTAAGFQSFAQAFTSGQSVYYCISDGTNWEVGAGTYTAGSPGSLSRDTIFDSSNGGAAVAWGVGTKDVFVTVPASVIATIGTSTLPVAALQTAAFTVGSSHAGKFVPCSGTFTATLSALPNGTLVAIKNVGSGTITIAGTVHGASTVYVGPNQYLYIVSDGSGVWYLISGSDNAQSTQSLSQTRKSSKVTLTSDLLTAAWTGLTDWTCVLSNGNIPVGKWYCEFSFISTASDAGIGIVPATYTGYDTFPSSGWIYRSPNGGIQIGGSVTGYGTPFTAAGTVVGMAINKTASSTSIWFRNAGIWQGGGDPVAGTGAAVSGISGELALVLCTAFNTSAVARFAPSSLSGSVPSGYSTLP